VDETTGWKPILHCLLERRAFHLLPACDGSIGRVLASETDLTDFHRLIGLAYYGTLAAAIAIVEANPDGHQTPHSAAV
jgi:hypothetical protein